MQRVSDGVCKRIPPSEFVAWCQAAAVIVRADEYAILCAIDTAYCAELNKELSDFQAREQDRREREAKKR